MSNEKNGLSLIKNNSSSISGDIGQLFENSDERSKITNNNERGKSFNDSFDDIENKFGSFDKSNVENKKRNSFDEDENSNNERSSSEYEFIEDNTIGKENSIKKNKSRKKNKEIVNKEEELSDDLDMVYSSSDNFIKDKYPKKSINLYQRQS